MPMVSGDFPFDLGYAVEKIDVYDLELQFLRKVEEAERHRLVLSLIVREHGTMRSLEGRELLTCSA